MNFFCRSWIWDETVCCRVEIKWFLTVGLSVEGSNTEHLRKQYGCRLFRPHDPPSSERIERWRATLVLFLHLSLWTGHKWGDSGTAEDNRPTQTQCLQSIQHRTQNFSEHSHLLIWYQMSLITVTWFSCLVKLSTCCQTDSNTFTPQRAKLALRQGDFFCVCIARSSHETLWAERGEFGWAIRTFISKSS